MKISPKEVRISTGVILELTNDDASHLIYALKEYNKWRKDNYPRQTWLWLDKLIEQLESANGEGSVMGGRLK